MSTPTGHYRHLGTSLAWDEHGLTLEQPDSLSRHVPWPRVHGARLLQFHDAELEILVQSPASSPATLDSVAVKVSSQDDAARLLTTINWHSTDARSLSPASLGAWRRGWLRVRHVRRLGRRRSR